MSKIYPDIDCSEFTDKVLNTVKKNYDVYAKKGAIGKKALGFDGQEHVNNTITRYQVCVLTALFITFIAGCFGTIVMWLTNTYDNLIFANLAIQNNSRALELWQRPSPKPIIKFYLFNYTNIYDFEAGDVEKLHVEEVGPYCYEETLERVNIKFDGKFLSYQEQRDYKFLPQLSQNRKQSDKVFVPNMPVFGAAALGKNSNFLTRFGISSLLSSMDAKPFLNIPAHKIITGYDDNLYSLSKNVMRMQQQEPYDRIGFLSSKSGKQPDVYVIDNGMDNINDIGRLLMFNRKQQLDYWSTRECNSFEGATDGTLFSPKMVRNKQDLKFFVKEMCRALPLEYEGEATIFNGRIPTYRYTIPYSVFDSPENTPDNQCFCNLESGTCPQQGLFNTSMCSFGLPVFISFPHFYNADPKLREAVTGLNPNHDQHKSYVDIHPTMGFAMSAKTRVQLNIQVHTSFGMSQVEMFPDELILPVAWFEMSVEDKTLPDDMVSLIFQTTYTIKSVELTLKYGSLATVIITSVSTILILKARLRKKIMGFMKCV